MDAASENVATQLEVARAQLADAKQIFATETTSEHREKWPNAFRLEGATLYALEALSAADPRINEPSAAEEMAGSATQARDAIRAAVDSGGGNLIESANRLLDATAKIRTGSFPGDLEDLTNIRNEIESARGKIESQIGGAATEIASQKDQAFTSISEAVDAVSTRREAAERQASELGIFTSAISAENLADAYAEVAKRTERQARWYTCASIATGVISIAVAGIGIYTASSSTEIHTYIARAALGIPVAVFAAYINSLASTHRREAWRLRHIELQIRTANPFLGLLDNQRQKETLAALALRFFPGQEGVSFDSKSAPGSSTELIDLVRMMLQQQGIRDATASAPLARAGQSPDSPSAS
jgi:hypothetical protein